MRQLVRSTSLTVLLPHLPPSPLFLSHLLSSLGGPAIPHNLTDWRLWLSSMHLYRNLTLSALNYSSINYQSPASQWMRRSFIQPQAMIHDRFLYSLDEGYTVDKYLADVEERYGGIDSVLLWHSYPNIGVDARNQFDMLRSLPAYPEGVRAMIARFHEKGVKVLIPFNRQSSTFY